MMTITPNKPTYRNHRQRRLSPALVMIVLSILGLDAPAQDDVALENPVRMGDLLECRSRTALATDLESVAALAESERFTCRHVNTVHQRSLTCHSEHRVTAFSAPVKEFTLSHAGGGAVSLSVALAAPTSRIERALANRDPDAAPDEILVEQREDGAAELRCRLDGVADNNASISGNLSFRGVSPLPAMRVCAAPVNDPAHPRCINSLEGDRHYRVVDLPAGRYFLTAFPLANNPNRLFVVHAPDNNHCVDGHAGCATTRLQAVDVQAGQAREGINLDTVLRELPASMGRRSR